MLIFSIINHPCSLKFVIISLVFICLGKLLLLGFISFRDDLSVAKLTQNAFTELF